jgi:uncharacterized membrane protein YphA (DoxX/SURF4 family)
MDSPFVKVKPLWLSLPEDSWLYAWVNLTLQVAIIFSSISFLFYGSSCLYSSAMVKEFARYHLEHLRLTTGILQITTSLTLLIGISYPYVAAASALFLVIMMIVALGVRYKIKDSVLMMLPAFFYLLINLYTFVTLSQTFWD